MASILPANLAELERDIDAALDRIGEIKEDRQTGADAASLIAHILGVSGCNISWNEISE